MMEAVSENTYALVEENGTLKRVPGSMLGGSGGVKTVIIKDSLYDDAISEVDNPVPMAGLAITYECINMTFEEAYETMKNGEPLMAVLMLVTDGPMCTPGIVFFAGTAADTGEPTIVISEPHISFMQFIWTANGIEEYQPK